MPKKSDLERWLEKNGEQKQAALNRALELRASGQSGERLEKKLAKEFPTLHRASVAAAASYSLKIRRVQRGVERGSTLYPEEYGPYIPSPTHPHEVNPPQPYWERLEWSSTDATRGWPTRNIYVIFDNPNDPGTPRRIHVRMPIPPDATERDIAFRLTAVIASLTGAEDSPERKALHEAIREGDFRLDHEAGGE